MTMLRHDEPDYKRVALAVFLAAVLLVGWQAKIEWPRRQALARHSVEMAEKKAVADAQHNQVTAKEAADNESSPSLTKEQRLAANPRIIVKSETISGSISLRGIRFDDLSLTKYRETIDPASPPVQLLAPNGDAQGFFAQAGWLSGDNKTKVPDQHSLWQADKKMLKPGDTVNLTWNNNEGVIFTTSITLDQDYMFSMKQKVENKTASAISVVPYGFVNRAYIFPPQAPFLHEGAIGVFNGTLTEESYHALKEKGNKSFEDETGWLGITDHYWLTTLIPTGEHNKATFSHYMKGDQERFQADYMGQAIEVAPSARIEHGVRLFAGAKELKLLDHYTTTDGSDNMPPVPLFDRTLDFGSFYFLAKPMCLLVKQIFDYTGNFGVALLIFIIFVKLCMYPLANKSYHSMAQMRVLQPEIVKIREKYVDDQIGLHKATRELYKREKVNPAAGCLPVLIQLIVFLALFRGLNVTIEMRHAPFFGWIKDLSAHDPSNLFTGFGLIDWTPPSFLHLGLLPILYCITMIVQTAQQPKPADPVQAKMMTWMPYFMLIFFDKMASGFVLYWTWSNIISIIQQRFISDRHKASQLKAEPVAAK